MPVILRAKAQNPDDPREITLDEYEQGRTNFKSYYYLVACNPDFSGQDIAISWDALNNAVNSFISANPGVTANEVAMRFVYCYDIATTSLYLRVQILTMQPQSQGSNVYNLIATPCAWYQISDAGGLTPTDCTDLYDDNYLNNLFYCAGGGSCDAGALIPLSGDGGTIYARTITFPWMNEINLMYIDNGSPVGASICFGACSYLHPSGGVPDLYPHGLVLYLKNAAGQDMLNDQDYVVVFVNKGCDMGTMCPPDCNVYIAPVV